MARPKIPVSHYTIQVIKRRIKVLGFKSPRQAAIYAGIYPRQMAFVLRGSRLGVDTVAKLHYKLGIPLPCLVMSPCKACRRIRGLNFPRHLDHSTAPF